jgi:hypothetical protein
MSGKKLAKAKSQKNKNTMKKKTKSNTSTQLLEKEFRSMPALLIQQLRKESAALKKQESSLRASLKKTQQQKTVADNKHTSLVAKYAEKQSATLKKQLNASKKINDKLNQNLKQLTSGLAKIQIQLSNTSDKQAQFLLISKEIAQLGKKTKAAITINKPAKRSKPRIEPLNPQDTNQQIQQMIESALSQPTETKS